MKEVMKKGIKNQYTAPTIIEIGSLSVKTLGKHRYRLDRGSPGCQDEDMNNLVDCENLPIS